MHDVKDILSNIEQIYDSTTNFQVLKDFERVLDELDIYVFDNWFDGELMAGPTVSKHWVVCSFMWPREKMPDPSGAEKLLEYDCHVTFQKSSLVEPVPIKKPSDVRPGTNKGKLTNVPIWVVEITMPKKLISDMWNGYRDDEDLTNDLAPLEQKNDIAPQMQQADELSQSTSMMDQNG